MPMYKTHPPVDRWPTLYTANQAYWDDSRRSGSLVIPIVLVVLLASLYLLFYAFVTINAGLLDKDLTPIGRILLLSGRVASLFIPVVLVLITFIVVSRRSREFFEAFYKPPEDTNASKLINSRLFGIVPTPFPLTSFFHYPFVLINIKEVTEGKFELPKHSVHWLGGPAILVVLDGAGLYLQRGNQFSRTLGPGIAFLERYETVKDVIDLRNQTIRSGQPGMPAQIGGRTKDGIKIFFNVEATFHIVRPAPQTRKMDKSEKNPKKKKTKAEKEAEELFLMGASVDSGDPEAIRKAYESTTVRYMRKADDRKYTEAKWCDGVWGTISGDLAKYITKHYLDELLVFEGPDNGDFLSAAAIPRNVGMPKAGQLLSWQEREKLRQSMDEFLRKSRGITLTNLRIVDFELPPEVNEQRLRVLDAEMQSRVRRIEGNAAAEQTRISGEMHAQAQQELISLIAEGLNKIDPSNFADSVLLSLSSILSQSLEDPTTSAVTARDTLAVLEQLREFLNRKEN